jgi:hypothetical protein
VGNQTKPKNIKNGYKLFQASDTLIFASVFRFLKFRKVFKDFQESLKTIGNAKEKKQKTKICRLSQSGPL